MTVRLAAALAVCLCAIGAEAQTLGDVARANEARRGSSGNVMVFDGRDVDPALAAREVLDWEVDAERWRRFQAADIWVTQALGKDPALLERLTTLRITTARILERFLAREPALAAALKSAGSDPHDYAYTQLALTVALLLNAQPLTPEQLANVPPATRANMTFVKAHERELKDMQRQAAQLRARMEK
jgi:hypothetical protein